MPAPPCGRSADMVQSCRNLKRLWKMRPSRPSSIICLGKRERRHAPVVVPDHVGDAGALHRVDHALRLGKVAAERLLARDHLAGLCRGDGDFGMRVVGAGDVDQVDVVALDQSAPVGLMRVKPPLGGEVAALVFVARADGDQFDAGLPRGRSAAPDGRRSSGYGP